MQLHYDIASRDCDTTARAIRSTWTIPRVTSTNQRAQRVRVSSPRAHTAGPCEYRAGTRPKIRALLISFARARRIPLPEVKSTARGRARREYFPGIEASDEYMGVWTSFRRYPGYGAVQRGSVSLDTGTRQPAGLYRAAWFRGRTTRTTWFQLRRPHSATQFPACVTGTLEGLGPVADVLVLESHFRRRAHIGIAVNLATLPRGSEFGTHFYREILTRFFITFFAQKKYQ